MHNIVLDAISIVGLVVMLVGGHTLFAEMSETPVNAIEVTAGRPAEVAGIRQGGTAIAEPDRPGAKFERGPVAETDNAVAARVDPDRAQSGDVQLSPRKKDRDVPKSSLSDFIKSDSVKSDFVISDDKFDTRYQIHTTFDMKIPEMKITRKPRVEAKRQAGNPPSAKQDSLENTQVALENVKTSACSGPQACSSEPPLVGVGF